MTDLIDTTEMYLRTIYELREDGVVPMRARIAEHLPNARLLKLAPRQFWHHQDAYVVEKP